MSHLILLSFPFLPHDESFRSPQAAAYFDIAKKVLMKLDDPEVVKKKEGVKIVFS